MDTASAPVPFEGPSLLQSKAVFDNAHLDAWRTRLAADAELGVSGRFLDVDLVVEVTGPAGSQPRAALVPLRAGRPAPRDAGPAPRVVVEASLAAWAAFLAPVPSPGAVDLVGLDRTRSDATIREGREVALRHLRALSHALALARTPAVGEAHPHPPEAGRPPPAAADQGPWRERATGSTWRLDVAGRSCRIFVEEAGQGIPLLCLHTAGSDSRQWRHLLADDELLARYRVVAFDLPAHGRSLPPDGWQTEELLLTADLYCAAVVAVADALALERPVLLGCSMGGSAVLELARRHPDRFGGAIGVSGAAKLEGRFSDLSLRPDLNPGELVPTWVWGLMSPTAPEVSRREVWWTYAQGAPGVYRAGTFFYSEDLDLRGQLSELDTAACPVVLLTGDYDYACTPEDSRRTAEAIPGGRFVRMPGLGHFAPAEDWVTFRPYLTDALVHVENARREEGERRD